jgi:hypothetical protein
MGFFVNVQKLKQLQNLRRVPDGGRQGSWHIIGELVVLLQSGVQELKKSHQDVLRLPLSWRLLSYPRQARDVASWPRAEQHNDRRNVGCLGEYRT